MSAPLTQAELFDADFLENLRAMFFVLRRRRKLRKKGAQSTPSSGHTREFKDHRAYVRGDDFRNIDWRLYARLDRLFVRIFEEIQEFHVHILIDRSFSMSAVHPQKRVLALRLAVALAYLALLGGHRVSLSSIGGGVEQELPPMKGQGNIHKILQHLARMEFGGQTDLLRELTVFRPRQSQRGIVFLLSDLFGTNPAESQEALRMPAHWPTETHVIHILAPEEMRPTVSGELLLEDAETGEKRRVWISKRDLEQYAQAFTDYQQDLERGCLSRQMDYLLWSTDHPFEDMFLALLSRGSALAGA